MTTLLNEVNMLLFLSELVTRVVLEFVHSVLVPSVEIKIMTSIVITSERMLSTCLSIMISCYDAIFDIFAILPKRLAEKFLNFF